MTVIHIGATMISAEATIKFDNDVETLKMLARQLLKERNEAHEMLVKIRDVINSGLYEIELADAITDMGDEIKQLLDKAGGES